MNLKPYIVATRAPFLSASVLPVFLTAAWCWRYGEPVHAWFLVTAAVGIGLVHLVANTANDFADWDNTDKINKYAGPFSGGSRVRLAGILGRGAFMKLVIIFTITGAAAVAVVSFTGRPLVGLFALIGGGIGYAYSLPPLSFQKRGIGEFFLFLAFGPLLTLGAGYLITGTVRWEHAAMGIIPGLLTTAILWINEFPDYEADREAGKRNLMVRIGRHKARWGYAGLVAGSYAALPILCLLGLLPLLAMAAFITLPLAIKATRHLWKHCAEPTTITAAQAQTILLQAAMTILITGALLADKFISR